MVIETKYSLDQEVWLLKDNKVINRIINHITTQTTGASGVATIIYYSLKLLPGDFGLDAVSEDKLFPSKEELLESL